MQMISQPCDTVSKILASIRSSKTDGRLLSYCTYEHIEGSYLLFNLLTRELVLLSEEEWQNRFENEYLKEHWFVVPEDCKDKEYADFVRWVLRNKQKKTKNITGYTIFPTTDCNARCFYCFELGRSRIPMTEETAHKVADYIAEHCGGEKVSLSWFGGEPLFNKKVIDVICKDLREKGIEYKSSMVSNGYLCGKETVQNAVENWNLKRVQITLDGTETIYNKVKAFIYKNTNPYHIVLTNIDHLLDSNVSVSIRLNMDMHNAENLLQLVEDLAQKFGQKKGLHVYAHHLFDGDKPMAETHTQEEWELRDAAMCRLNDKIRQHGLAAQSGIRKTPKVNHCMADSGNAVTILPGGEIGLCEHFSESEFIGHIDVEGFEQVVVNSWRETSPEIPECAECFYYPDCLQPRKCASGSVCFEHLRRERRRQVERQMLNEYRMWKSRETVEQTDEDTIC